MEIFDALFLCFLLMTGFCFGCVFFARRYLWRRKRRAKTLRRGFYPNAAMLGNALHQLQAIAEPQVRHVVQGKLDDHEEEDDETGPKDPTKHLKRQLRRIRDGEEIDRLIVFRKG
jgi:hypothetical protein